MSDAVLSNIKHGWRKAKTIFNPSNKPHSAYDSISYTPFANPDGKAQVTYHKASSALLSRRDRIKSEIVLLDTESELNNIKCISTPFNENAPAYYAVSYRWGKHPEWKAQTPNYVAAVTSISQSNLIKLCEYYRRRIRYLWIDVICINQADKEHRKMAIKNMDSIYQRATRIIAVPDLCYCAENPLKEHITKENIEATIIEMANKAKIFGILSRSERKIIETLFDKNEPAAYLGIRLDVNEQGKQMQPWNKGNGIYCYLDYYTGIKEQIDGKGKGSTFILPIITEWAERAWVVSERTIGVNDKKLLVHILRANAVVHWAIFWWINWSFDSDPYNLVKTVLESKSSKPIDRLFAILPHTRYKNAVKRLVDEEITINDETDLKWILFDILDTRGKNKLLTYLFWQYKEHVELLLLSVKKKRSRLDEPVMLSRYDDDGLDDVEIQDIQGITTRHGRRALKVLLPFMDPYPQNSNSSYQLLDAADGSELQIINQYDYLDDKYNYIMCRKSNSVWKITSNYYLVPPQSKLQYGEFLIFL